jgi:KUP system potassium uptake protein
MNTSDSRRSLQAALVLGALGVVYGDIGTSPLYALRECFHGSRALAPTRENVLGVLSLIFWSLLFIVSLKYLAVIMRASSKGEGGILALMALAIPDRASPDRLSKVLLWIGVFGAALLYGDGMITPAVTVLSAVEGLNVATPVFEPYMIPIAVVILVGLFAIQKRGTGAVGRAFGPVMAVWFVTLAVLGLAGVWKRPEVIQAVNPLYGLRFLAENGWAGLIVLGAVFLAVTGAEALYADMGHFGPKAIRLAWFSLVLPSLFLNYLGQGALLLVEPAARTNPFYNLAPAWGTYPLVGLATVAAVIASQALIAGVFSLTMQAVQLGYLPRLTVTHTSFQQRGQIYVPDANWALMAACITLVLGFGSSSRLAGAYGVAVVLTMLMTTCLFYFAARRLWGWSVVKTAALTGIFLLLELAFCVANLAKVAHGGWVPLALAAVLFTVMSTWRTGRQMLRKQLAADTLSLELFLEDLDKTGRMRVSGTAVFLAGNPQGTPLALLHNFKHNKVLHERNVLLTIAVQDVAHVDGSERLQVERLPNGFYRVIGNYGFMDQPDVPDLLAACQAHGLKFDLTETTFFLSSETIVRGSGSLMAPWRQHLFAALSRNAQRATAFFGLPPNRVVELGMQIEI